MTIYKVYHDAHIEAKNGNEAEEILMEQNAANCATYYTDEAEAKKAYESIAADLDEPKKLGGDLYWFDGVVLDVAEGCDEPEEDETLADAFHTGFYSDSKLAIKKHKRADFDAEGLTPHEFEAHFEEYLDNFFPRRTAECSTSDWMEDGQPQGTDEDGLEITAFTNDDCIIKEYARVERDEDGDIVEETIVKYDLETR